MQNRSRSGQSYDSSSSDSDRDQRRYRKVKSGISAKPMSSVKYQQKYPHFSLGQQTGFIGLNIQFNQLTYEQFMAGEMSTIINTKNDIECEGRMQLLCRIALWRLRAGVAWQQV